ncbi:MAG: hypothetical protein GY788_32375 [bacterium]|nr:hypothetical protein [bacterium]
MQGDREFIRDVEDYANIASDFVRGNAKNKITKALIDEAMAGNGKGGKKYQPYSDAYDKIKKRQSGQRQKFMYGIGKGRHMLDATNFRWRTRGKTTVELVWTASGKQGDYARVHNDGLGNMPKREWMHLEAPKTSDQVDSVLQAILAVKADKFTRKYGR